jgi:hypothetical protein
MSTGTRKVSINCPSDCCPTHRLYPLACALCPRLTTGKCTCSHCPHPRAPYPPRHARAPNTRMRNVFAFSENGKYPLFLSLLTSTHGARSQHRRDAPSGQARHSPQDEGQHRLGKLGRRGRGSVHVPASSLPPDVRPGLRRRDPHFSSSHCRTEVGGCSRSKWLPSIAGLRDCNSVRREDVVVVAPVQQ